MDNSVRLVSGPIHFRFEDGWVRFELLSGNERRQFAMRPGDFLRTRDALAVVPHAADPPQRGGVVPLRLVTATG